ncbi:unnamed protein product [Calicophoron daubneyi]|uniref:Globin domain-containing protein n=1 Tax=Calicophoron daubneyi TaxID=300641 RepID=A0AAV2TMR7_CALDB
MNPSSTHSSDSLDDGVDIHPCSLPTTTEMEYLESISCPVESDKFDVCVEPSTIEEESKSLEPVRPQGSRLMCKVKRGLRWFLDYPNESSALHKSMQDLPSSHIQCSRRKSCSTENNMTNISFRQSGKTLLTSDVPTDISEIKRYYQKTTNDLTSLSDRQEEYIKSSWKFLKAHIEKIGVVVFLELFEEHSDFRDAFARFRGKQLMELSRDPAFQAHGLRVLNVVDKIISRLNKPEGIQDYLLSLGGRHCKYTPSIALVSNVGEQLLETIRPVLEEQGTWDTEMETAWIVVINYLTSAMRYGIARGAKKCK